MTTYKFISTRLAAREKIDDQEDAEAIFPAAVPLSAAVPFPAAIQLPAAVPIPALLSTIDSPNREVEIVDASVRIAQ